MKAPDPDQAWISRLGSPDGGTREQALLELWTGSDENLIERLAAKASPTLRDELTLITGRRQLGITPDDGPRLIELADRFEKLPKPELLDFMNRLGDLPGNRKAVITASALQRSASQPDGIALWATQADGAIHSMENRITQRAGRVGPNSGVLPMRLAIEAQEQLQAALREIATRVTDPSARENLLKALNGRFSESKVYSITTLDFFWNQRVPESSPLAVRAIQALLDLNAVSPAIEAAGTEPEAIGMVANFLMYDEKTIGPALETKPPRHTAVSILAALVRLPGSERNAGLAAAIRLDEAWKPWPATDAEVTSVDRDFAYHAAAAASGKHPDKALEFASRYLHPSAASVVGRSILSRSKIQPPPPDAKDRRARVLAADISTEVKLVVLQQLSMAHYDAEIEAFLDLTRAWFPEPDAAKLPSWHTITRGLARLRLERDWPAAIELLNRADHDPAAGRLLSTEINNQWPGWREAAGGRPLPSLDVSLMSPDLFLSFLSGIEFQWENSPLNLKGYQLHLKGKEIRWTLVPDKREPLHLVPMAREAELAGDRDTAWELLQLIANGALSNSNSWRPKDPFATEFPMAAYLSHARARSAIAGELERLDALTAKQPMRPPVILTAALELSRGDEGAALQRLEAEKFSDSSLRPSIAERLELLREFVSKTDIHDADPAASWSQWMKGFPKD